MTLENYIDKNFGYGIENYTPEQIEAVRNFVRAALSSEFGYVERESLKKILNKILRLSDDELEEAQDTWEA